MYFYGVKISTLNLKTQPCRKNHAKSFIYTISSIFLKNAENSIDDLAQCW